MDCNQNCNRGSLCACLIISLIIGIVVGVLSFFEFIPQIIVAAWIAFGLGVLNLVFLVFGAFSASVQERSGLSKCLCKNGLAYFAGIIATIALSIILLSIVINIANIFHVVLIGLTAFSLAFTVCQLGALIKCVVCRLCKRHYEKNEISD